MEYMVLAGLVLLAVVAVIWLICGKHWTPKKSVITATIALVCCVALAVGGSFGVTKIFNLHDHELVIVEKVLPTCTEPGYIVYDCAGCDDLDHTGVIAKKAHRLDEWEVLVEPTCAPGKKRAFCEDCGFEQFEEIPHNQPHDLGPWVTVKPATCANQGLEQAVCKNCGTVKENILPMHACSW